MTRTITVRFYCTGAKNDVPHDPVAVYGYEGPVPPPVGFFGMPGSVFSLDCERRKGGCGYGPRPSDEWMRGVIERLADTPIREVDIRYSGL